MTALAEQHPRWGYRMVHGLLVEEGWEVNLKRVHRLWRQEGLQVPPRRLKGSGQKAIGDASNSATNLPALYRNHVWSHDFMSARTVDGGALRILNVLDEHTREALGSKVARSIGSESVRKHLERLFAKHGKPKYIRADNGREFISDIAQDLAAHAGRHADLHREGQPDAELLHRAVQRLDAPRATQRRAVPLRARGEGRNRGMAAALQHPPAPPRAWWQDARRLRQDVPESPGR